VTSGSNMMMVAMERTINDTTRFLWIVMREHCSDLQRHIRLVLSAALKLAAQSTCRLLTIHAASGLTSSHGNGASRSHRRSLLPCHFEYIERRECPSMPLEKCPSLQGDGRIRAPSNARLKARMSPLPGGR